MLKFTFYIIYNAIYQFGSFFFFLYANTYLNEGLVPENFVLKADKYRTGLTGLGGVAIVKSSAVLCEAAVLIIVIYVINRLILSDTEGEKRRRCIANRTAKVNVVASLCFIAILIWGSFRGFLW